MKKSEAGKLKMMHIFAFILCFVLFSCSEEINYLESGDLVTNENTFALATPVVPFTVGEVELIVIASTEVTVRFTTSANSKAYIDYGEDNNYGNQNTGDWTLNNATHQQDIATLEPGKTYFYKIVAINESGEQATASGSFTTVVDGEGRGTLPFTVGAIEILDLGDTEARIKFTTSANSQAYVEYGIGTGYDSRTGGEKSFDFATHGQFISNLEPGTTYYYKVRANNKNWQTASATGSFTTAEESNGTNGEGREKINSIGAPGTVKRILDEFTVSMSHTNTQMETIDVKDGNVYIAYIEAGSEGDGARPKLHNTVVAKGTFNGSTWNWTKHVIDRRTAYDVWHAAPSIIVDNDGYIHVAYNMHNLPWQYQVSKNPYDITSWEFKGQSITDAEFDRYYIENKTSFPSNGTGAIPGNQISYPALYKDGDGDIYATYRFAAQPKRSYPERMMSSGVSSYDTTTKRWTAIGAEIVTRSGTDYDAQSGAPSRPTVVAGQEGWTAYFPQLAFDDSNTMHFSGVWRAGTAGAITGRPFYMRSSNHNTFQTVTGQSVSLPLTPDRSGNIDGISNSQGLNSITSLTVTPSGNPYYLVLLQGIGTKIYSYNNGSWSSENSPGGATEIFTDADGTLYAIADGVKIYKKSDDGWSEIYNASACGYYHRVALNADKSIAYIHTLGCDTRSSVYALQLK